MQPTGPRQRRTIGVIVVLQLPSSHAPFLSFYGPLFRVLQRRHNMKFLSAAFILLLTSVSGVALAGDGQPVGARYAYNQVLSANSDQRSADSDSIHCACVVPMTYA